MVHDLRAILRWSDGRADDPTAAMLDGRTAQRTPERGHRAGDDGDKRRKGSKIHLAVDNLGHLLALHVTPANAQERDQAASPLPTHFTVTLFARLRGLSGSLPRSRAQW